ncbi:hypothetical protein NCU05826 [Neurospora crassa OR74A]|uniref:Uncharacterized protein n=1 Tax=Neurospora crassa (strain ATCC 24698 / 74-OR23-1A / CBS 708.71 / DSM 1257 / FGSC 987) TaxID=367110 RepID=Q7S5L7_NEUCR|nr:hypothetical protein NCU05826 [Neurospora crassa OR74A]EAA30850.1 hypothetical protein NCU05826 [Neurospora crassa OR74A]|eukprot:XP_960086.1 hypothetical protein NCU05826 [Neurospora crassa OR74A]
MDNQDGFHHGLEKRIIQEVFDKLLSPLCKAFPKAPGCPTPEEPVEAPPQSTTPTTKPTTTPAPAATSPPAVVAPPPAATKTQPASPPVVTQPPVVVAPPATTAPAVVKPSPTSITPQPTKGAEQGSGSNHGTKSGEGSGQGNEPGSGPGSNGADKGNAGNAGNDGSNSGKGATGPVGSDNDNNTTVPPPSMTSDTTAVQPTATSASFDGNAFFPGNVVLAAPLAAPSQSSESGEHTVGDGTLGDGDNWTQGSQPSATSYNSAIQHNGQAISTTLSTAWVAAGTPTSIPAVESTIPGQASGSDDPSRGNPDLYPTPGSTHTPAGGGSTTGNSDSPAGDSPNTSSTGLVSGIAGGVITIVVLFFVLFLLLYKYRRNARVQNFLIKYTPLKVAAYTKRDKKRSSMGKGLLLEDDEPTSPTMTEKGKNVNYGTILPAPVTQPNPTASRAPTKAIPPPGLDTAHGLRSPTPNENRHSMFERVSTSMSDYFPQPPSPTHSHHSRGNSVESLGGVSIASSGIFSASMLPPSTACSNSTASWALPPSTSHSQAMQFQPLQPMPMPMRQSGLSTTQMSSSSSMAAPREGHAGPSNWRDRPDSWGF